MKLANDQVSIGDSFAKVGTWSGTVYVVASLVGRLGCLLTSV